MSRGCPVNATVMDLICQPCLSRTVPQCHLIIPPLEDPLTPHFPAAVTLMLAIRGFLPKSSRPTQVLSSTVRGLGLSPAVVCHATPTKNSPQRKESSENSCLQNISERKHAACAASDHAWTSLGRIDRLARGVHPSDLMRHMRHTVSDSKLFAPSDPLYVDHLFVETFSPASP